MIRMLVAAALLLPSMALAELSPYAGQQHRPIKALAPETIHALLEGRGMELAKPAELNSYPGPRHVQELAQELRLTADQLAAIEPIYARMAADAKALGAAIVEKEWELDRLFAGRTAVAASVEFVTGEIGVLQGRLRAVHLKAHLEMTNVLTASQIARYDLLRGYSGIVAGQPHAAEPDRHGRH